MASLRARTAGSVLPSPPGAPYLHLTPSLWEMVAERGGGGWGADKCQDLLVILTNHLKTKSYNFPKKETNHPQFLNISPEIILILQNMSIYAKRGSGGSKAINQNRWRSLYFGGFPIISTIAVDENAIHNYNASRSSWAKASLETASKPGIQTIIRPTLSLAEASSLQLKTIK